MQSGISCADLPFKSTGPQIAAVIKFQASPREVLANPIPDSGLVLSDSAGEDNGFRATHAGEKRTDVFSNPIAEDLDCKTSSAVVVILCFSHEDTHIVG